MEQVWRYATSADLTDATAERLMRHLVGLQATQDEPVRLCLTGGRIANRIYEVFADLADDFGLDQARVAHAGDPGAQAAHDRVHDAPHAGSRRHR